MQVSAQVITLRVFEYILLEKVDICNEVDANIDQLDDEEWR